MRTENETPKFLNCCASPRVTLGVVAITKGNKWRVITVPPPNQPWYFTASTAPPTVAKEVGRAPPRVQMAPIIMNVEASVTVPPAIYTRSGKASLRKKIEMVLHKIQKHQEHQAVNTPWGWCKWPHRWKKNWKVPNISTYSVDKFGAKLQTQ